MNEAIFVLKMLGHWSLGKALIYILLGLFIFYQLFGD